MTLFEKVQQEIATNSGKIANGEVLMIDLSLYYPRFSRLLPGFVKGDQILLFGASGVGKSRLTRHMFVKLPIALAAKSALKPKIFLNSLEESPEKVATTFIISYLKEKHNLDFNFYSLLYPKEPHSAEVLAKIAEGEAYYKHIEKYLEVVSIAEPFGFYKHIRDYLFTIGTFYMGDTPISPGERWDRYEYNDPNQFVIAISDNINVYSETNGQTWYETVKKFSAYYSRKLLGIHCGVISVIVQQQVSTKEQLDARADTYILEKKLEPSLDALGDFKISQRDALIAIGIFDPARYDIIKHHAGWNLDRMNGHYRSIHLLKHREGVANKILPCYADLSRDHFEELPEFPSEEGYRKYGL